MIARAHHGSVSKEQRALIEDDLKRGRLPCVVATSSLELGIDMGAVDLVVQIESPPRSPRPCNGSDRAGHQVGEVSRGVLLPKHRGDLVHTAVAVERMRQGAIEALKVPPTRSTCSPSTSSRPPPIEDWDVDDAVHRGPTRGAVHHAPALGVRRDARPAQRAATPATSSASSARALVWDRVAGTLTGRPGPSGSR